MAVTKILGDYNIIKQIGQGSLGTVFLAEHRFMKKHYALKVLPEELSADRSFIQRFDEEVAKLATLEHPNIVKVHNISYADGLYFLVTDCVVDEMGETTNLAQYVINKGKRLSEAELFGLLEQVASALDYAHNKKVAGLGISHCGVKLNNILVSKGPSGVKLFLSDFGLTRIVGPGAVLSRTYKVVADALSVAGNFTAPIGESARYPSPPLTEDKLIPLHASFLQTFAFLAPEQKQLLHPKTTGINVDVYAFGVLAYYLMMGQFPDGVFDMPSVCIEEYRWNWDSLIHNCLQVNPEKRIKELLPALHNVKQSKPEPVAMLKSEVKFEAIDDKQPPAETVVTHPSAQQYATRVSTPVEYSHPQQRTPESTPEIASPKPELRVATHLQPRHVARATQPQMQEQEPQVATATALEDAPEVQVSLRPVLNDTQLERPVADPDPGAIFMMESTVTQYVPEKKEVKDVKPILTEMIVINGGAFQRGSTDGNRDEMPKHQVNIDSFAIDVHPVTNEQFVRFLEALGGEKDANHNDIIRLRDSRIKRSGGKTSIESGYAKHPVVGVTWYGAAAYAKWIGKRLPTEAEWEVAAKGGNESALFPTGDDIEKTQANFFSADTIAVKSYAPNDYGLHDMAGNVYEWCLDWYGYNYYETSIQEPDNPKGPLQGVYRVLRGGCWKSLREDLRCSRRHRNNPGTVNGTYGFRCAADVE